MKAVTFVLALASAANAHMLMRTPLPANNPHQASLFNNGSDFPCQRQNDVFDVSAGPANPPVAPGGKFTLNFMGSAIHGGGSCQVSLAKGWTINKDSEFKVIHSIEGSCPGAAPGGADLNLSPADASNTAGLSEYQITVPDHPDLPPGQYTLAWSWNNRIGNREFYMNCAQFTIGSGGSSSNSTSKRDAAPLPDIFKGNIGSCVSPEGGDVVYPNPGQSLETGTYFKPIQPSGDCGPTGAAQGSSVATATGTGSSAANTGSAAAGSSSPSPTSAPASSQVSSAPAGSTSDFAYATSSMAADSSAVASSLPASSDPAASSEPATTSDTAASSVPATTSAPAATTPEASSAMLTSAAALPASSDVSTGSTGSAACDTEGGWSCAADGGSFQRCVYGQWSVAITMAAGTKCVPGISDTLQYAGVAAAPSKRHNHAHAHHHDV